MRTQASRRLDGAVSESATPLRVLHVIDGLAGGGSERWIWDIVRLSDPRVVCYRVLTVHPDLGRFVYAARLRQAGALGPAAPSPPRPAGSPAGVGLLRRMIGSLVEGMPRRVRSALRFAWHMSVVFPSAIWFGWRELRAFEPDLVHAHTFHGLALGLLLAGLSRRPLVYTVSGLVSQIGDAGYGWVPRLCARYHHRVSLLLTAYPSEAHLFGMEGDRTVQLDPVGDVAAVQTVSAGRDGWRRSIREGLGLDDRATILLSVGRLHRSKGHQYVIPALERVLAVCPTAHWVVLGDGDDRADLQARAAAAGLSAHVHLVGFVDEPLSYYAAADVYLRTAIFEGDNFSSLYAMAMGVPVVAFDTRCETELITRARHGVLVPVADADRLGQGIVDLLLQPEIRAEMGGRGARYAYDNLDIRHAVEKIIAGYRAATAERARPITVGKDLDAEAPERS